MPDVNDELQIRTGHFAPGFGQGAPLRQGKRSPFTGGSADKSTRHLLLGKMLRNLRHHVQVEAEIGLEGREGGGDQAGESRGFHAT